MLLAACSSLVLRTLHYVGRPVKPKASRFPHVCISCISVHTIPDLIYDRMIPSMARHGTHGVWLPPRANVLMRGAERTGRKHQYAPFNFDCQKCHPSRPATFDPRNLAALAALASTGQGAVFRANNACQSLPANPRSPNHQPPIIPKRAPHRPPLRSMVLGITISRQQSWLHLSECFDLPFEFSPPRDDVA
ncbi:hypothetical protein B0H67DRAFT_359518 [Lasiosphaeris hirsuta]|uniref:Uncharacterized protein n=1 Tax=Lasiosphaeris hirsuta TaxID=260670 RepID=A0AA39ZWC7_9PEZI|nr:hypothetical protein B0H67DRAFT_359518 [Lasiosphaeris hirsuta]